MVAGGEVESLLRKDGNNTDAPSGRGAALTLFIWRVACIKGSAGHNHPFLMLFLPYEDSTGAKRSSLGFDGRASPVLINHLPPIVGSMKQCLRKCSVSSEVLEV